MKNILMTIITVAIFLISCEKSFKATTKSPVLQIEKIHEDIIFQETILEIQRLYTKTQDFGLLIEYLKDDKISENEEINIHKIFGYEDRNQYVKDIREQKNRILLLDKKYNLKNQPDSLIMMGIKNTFKKLNIFQTRQSSIMSLSNTCESIRRNCIASVAAEATIMHIGCGLLDLTVVAGIACHGAALTYQWSAGQNCNLEAKKCLEEAQRNVVNNNKIPDRKF